MIDIKQAASMVGEPINAGSGDQKSLTDGQRAFLDGLDPDRRAKFDGLNPQRRAFLLLGFRHGPDRVAVMEVEKTIGGWESSGPSPEAEPPVLATAAEDPTPVSVATPYREALIARMLAAGGVQAEQARAHIVREEAKRRDERRAASSRVSPEERDAAVALILQERSVPDPAMLDMLDRVRPGCQPNAVGQAVDVLCRLLRDEKSRKWYYCLLNGVRDGEIPAEVPIFAYAHSCDPGCDDRGRWFNAAVKRCGFDPKRQFRSSPRNAMGRTG